VVWSPLDGSGNSFSRHFVFCLVWKINARSFYFRARVGVPKMVKNSQNSVLRFYQFLEGQMLKDIKDGYEAQNFP